MYNWPNVAQRTEAVYRAALAAPAEQDALLPRLRRYRSIGSWAGLLFCCVVVLLHWFWRLLEWQQPAQCVEPAADWPAIEQMLACVDEQQKLRQWQRQQLDDAHHCQAHHTQPVEQQQAAPAATAAHQLQDAATQQLRTLHKQQLQQHHVQAPPPTEEQQAAVQGQAECPPASASRRYNLRSSARQGSS